MSYSFTITLLYAYAEKAIKDGYQQLENIQDLQGLQHMPEINFKSEQKQQAINNYRIAAISYFENASLLFTSATKNCLRDHNYDSNVSHALNLAEKAETEGEKLKSSDNPPLELSLKRITHPSTIKLEHHVASWATTMAIQIFQNVKHDQGRSQWIYTPEQRDEQSGKIPDFVLEQARKDEDGTLHAKPLLHMEYKKLGGDPPYKALHQLATAVIGKLQESDPQVLTIYLVVVVGRKISFWDMDFEAIKDHEPEQEVKSVWGCRSLLQSGVKYDGNNYEHEEPPYTTDKGNIPTGVKKLFISRYAKKSDPRRDAAETYPTPAILDFSKEEHKGPIKKMFEYMARYEPRGF
jgi:hypothetical protein